MLMLVRSRSIPAGIAVLVLLGSGLLFLGQTAATFAARFEPPWETEEAVELARSHRGPGPCLRYSDARVSSTEAKAIASEMADAQSPSSSLAVLGRLAYEDERLRHGPLTDAELDARLARRARGLVDRLRLAIFGPRIRAALRSVISRDETRYERLVHARNEDLNAGQRVALQKIWSRHLARLDFGSVLDVGRRYHELRRDLTGALPVPR